MTTKSNSRLVPVDSLPGMSGRFWPNFKRVQDATTGKTLYVSLDHCLEAPVQGAAQSTQPQNK
jgi:hypothetical protein